MGPEEMTGVPVMMVTDGDVTAPGGGACTGGMMVGGICADAGIIVEMNTIAPQMAPVYFVARFMLACPPVFLVSMHY